MGCGSSKSNDDGKKTDTPNEAQKPKDDAPPLLREPLPQPSDVRAEADKIELKVKGVDYDNLAYEDPKALGGGTYETAVKVADRLEAYVLSCFPDDKIKNDEFDELVLLLRIKQFVPIILNAAGFDQSVKKFVADMKRVLLLNPILVLVAAELDALSEGTLMASFPDASPERDAEVRKAIVFAYILHGIGHENLYEKTTKVTGQTTFFEQIATSLLEYRETTSWGDYTNLFEKLKIVSVDLPIRKKDGFIEMKQGVGKVAESPALLSVNILEAVYQDTKVGRDANAVAGYELMMEPTSRPPIPGLENQSSRLYDESTGAIARYAPFPKVWNNLYSSWNMAFVTQYKDWPMIMSKLVNPIVAGTYHDVDPGLYIVPRGVTLFVLLNWLVINRAANKSTETPGLEWRDQLLALVWGKVNEKAGLAYQKRVETALDASNGLPKELAYELKRGAVGASWASLRGAIVLTTTAAELGDDACEEFLELRGKLLGESPEMHAQAEVYSVGRELGKPNAAVPKALREAYTADPAPAGFVRVHGGANVRPYDLVFIRGASASASLQAYLKGDVLEAQASRRKSASFPDLTAHDFAQVGIIVTKESMPVDGVDDGHVYVLTAGEADENGCGRPQFTEFDSFCKKAAGSGDLVAVAHLAEQFRSKIDTGEAAAAKAAASYSAAADDGAALSSALVARVLRDQGVLDGDVQLGNVVPMDFVGFDIDGEIPTVVSVPWIVEGTFQ